MKKVHLKSEQLEKNQFMLASEVNMQTCFVKSLERCGESFTSGPIHNRSTCH